MAAKEYIGITYEYDRLRLARLQEIKGKLRLLDVETLELPTPLSMGTGHTFDLLEKSEKREEEAFFESGDSGNTDVFSILDHPEKEENIADESPGGLDDHFDMVKSGQEEETDTDNELLLSNYFSGLGKRKIHTGLHIPFGKTAFQLIKNVDPASMKKRERHEFFIEKLRSLSKNEIRPDQYAWCKIDDDTSLLACNPDEIELVNLVELAETYFNGTIRINEVLPDEGIWAGLVRTHYNPGEEEITGLIAVGESACRIVFMKGRQIMNTLPVITEGENSDTVQNTIYSKILFEIDKGNVPGITRLLIVHSSKTSKAIKEYFEKQFDETEVDFLTPDPEKFEYADELMDSPVFLQPYMTAIGAACAASKRDEEAFSELSLLPEYIRERQQVLKLSWHGILVLILIALTPLYLNNIYFQKVSELQTLQQQNALLETQIRELRPVVTMTEDLMQELGDIEQENTRLRELAGYSQQWSEINRILNQNIANIPGVWLTSLRTSDDHVVLTGMSLSRRGIPSVGEPFSDANVRLVNETELRDQTVYTFSMQINNIRQDLDDFLLEIPHPEYDSEFRDEMELVYEAIDERTISASLRVEPDEAVQTGPEESPGPAEEIRPSDSGESGANPYGLTGPEDEMLTGAFTIVLHSIPMAGRAESEYNRLREQGYKATLSHVRLEEGKMTWRIGVGQFETVQEALASIPDLPESFRRDYFITRIR